MWFFITMVFIGLILIGLAYCFDNYDPYVPLDEDYDENGEEIKK